MLKDLLLALWIGSVLSENTQDLELVKADITAEGGRYIDDEGYPYVVGVFSDEVLITSGILITPSQVLTNAVELIIHGKEISQQNLTVRMGSSNLQMKYVEYNVVWVYFHPFLYQTRSEMYDIAVLTLEREVSELVAEPMENLSRMKDLAQESVFSLVSVSSECIQLGFGSKGKGVSTGYLRSDPLRLLPWLECQTEMDQANRNWKVIPEYEICATKGDKGNCLNEMGAPLICNGKVYGLMTDFDPDCKPSPTIFIRVDVFQSFIDLSKYCPDQCMD